MFPPRTKGVHRTFAFALALGSLLAGCSDIYLDRRETISSGAGDAVAANAIEQTNDPWPRNSSNRHLTFNGQRMERAVGCYRIDKVTPPVDINPSTDALVGITPPPAAVCDNKMLLDDAQSAGGTSSGGTSGGNSNQPMSGLRQ
jgi:hypothetical protein